MTLEEFETEFRLQDLELFKAMLQSNLLGSVDLLTNKEFSLEPVLPGKCGKLGEIVKVTCHFAPAVNAPPNLHSLGLGRPLKMTAITLCAFHD
ncbi:hypothetical protein J2W23_005867 [Variovorax boronicumulans]|nr:hypothetical protein [Variovorax boronicumulans]